MRAVMWGGRDGERLRFIEGEAAASDAAMLAIYDFRQARDASAKTRRVNRELVGPERTSF